MGAPFFLLCCFFDTPFHPKISLIKDLLYRLMCHFIVLQYRIPFLIHWMCRGFFLIFGLILTIYFLRYFFVPNLYCYFFLSWFIFSVDQIFSFDWWCCENLFDSYEFDPEFHFIILILFDIRYPNWDFESCSKYSSFIHTSLDFFHS